MWRLFPAAAMAEYLEMMTGSVLDILIYVFDRYMLNEAPDVPEREHLARDLEQAGFAPDNVERALDWLDRPGLRPRAGRRCAAAGHGQRACGCSPTASWRACRPSAAACC